MIRLGTVVVGRPVLDLDRWVVDLPIRLDRYGGGDGREGDDGVDEDVCVSGMRVDEGWRKSSGVGGREHVGVCARDVVDEDVEGAHDERVGYYVRGVNGWVSSGMSLVLVDFVLQPVHSFSPSRVLSAPSPYASPLPSSSCSIRSFPSHLRHHYFVPTQAVHLQTDSSLPSAQAHS